MNEVLQKPKNELNQSNPDKNHPHYEGVKGDFSRLEPAQEDLPSFSGEFTEQDMAQIPISEKLSEEQKRELFDLSQSHENNDIDAYGNALAKMSPEQRHDMEAYKRESFENQRVAEMSPEERQRYYEGMHPSVAEARQGVQAATFQTPPDSRLRSPAQSPEQVAPINVEKPLNEEQAQWIKDSQPSTWSRLKRWLTGKR